MDKESITKVATSARLPRFTQKALFDRANIQGDYGYVHNDALLYNYDIAREEGVRIAIAFFRDKIGKEPDTDTIVAMILQVYDDALQGSL